MNGTYLVYGGTQKARTEKIDTLLHLGGVTSSSDNNPDFNVVDLLTEKKSIGIAEVKSGIKFLHERPFSHKNKVLLVNNADKLTPDAQNALLKTLEEPPQYAILILNSKTERDLLETVISRCRRIPVTGDHQKSEATEEFVNYQQLTQASQGEKLAIAEKLAKEEKDTIIDILESWLYDARTYMKLTDSPRIQVTENIKSIIKTKDDLENFNVNTRLTVETLLLLLR